MYVSQHSLKYEAAPFHVFLLFASKLSVSACITAGEQLLTKQNKNPGTEEAQLDLKPILLPTNL